MGSTSTSFNSFFALPFEIKEILKCDEVTYLFHQFSNDGEAIGNLLYDGKLGSMNFVKFCV